ncbi:hypothetical protein J2T13_002502 [Paenibacillus sp. DS2015]|uniref:GerMN domain-containing protein n=1 Tax=Paenibacillus sp. DS2015 TaxID=3373917 RepID=UPI003D20AC45
MNKKLWCIGLLVLVMVVGVACGQKPTTQPSASNDKANSVTDGQGAVTSPEESTDGSNNNESEEGIIITPTTPEPTPEVTPQVTPEVTPEVTPDSVETTAKKETIEVYFTDPQAMELMKSKQEITYKNDTQKYEAAFKALTSTENSELIPLWAKIELKSLDIKEGAITLDIHLPDEARQGAGEEQFAIDALRKTLFQFDEVKSIELLVDGAKGESLMGHVELEHPMMK